MIPVNIPMLRKAAVVGPADIQRPKARKAKPKVSPALQKAAKDYKAAYKAVYHLDIRLTFSKGWIRIHGQDTGVSLKRLKELTAQLRNRA